MSRGFTLIELLIVVALIGVMALIAMPFTSSWATDSQVKEFTSEFQRAYKVAKQAAIRDPNQVVNEGDASAALCLFPGDSVIQVRVAGGGARGGNLGPAHCDALPRGNVIVSQYVLAEGFGIALSNIDQPINCLCFEKNGQLTNTGAGCGACSTSNRALSIAVSKGDSRELVTLY